MKYSNLSNIKARNDSHAPETVAAWDDHFIVQFKQRHELKYSNVTCVVSLTAANMQAARFDRESKSQHIIRIVYPTRRHAQRTKEPASVQN